ncbi:MAG: flagellar basal body rod protein FlgC [Acidobacteriaceae bacterium]|jgi:flagellar basal-body rod protein FlgC|nr:flagellar basal body rod protein FlgC [Acidobacteriaceae bacterium]
MSLFNLLSVSASGMAAQRRRAEVLVENLANAETTRTPEGGPYRRKDVIFESAAAEGPFSAVFASQLRGTPGNGQTPGNRQTMEGVRIAEVVQDQREPEKRYQPGHPDADKEGYVSYPHLNPAEEMVDLMSASRGYQSNVAAMAAAKEMIQKTLDIMRG